MTEKARRQIRKGFRLFGMEEPVPNRPINNAAVGDRLVILRNIVIKHPNIVNKFFDEVAERLRTQTYRPNGQTLGL
jgi:hypothetical protein